MTNIKRIGVFTSGGDAPGMNAAIRAVARTAYGHQIECVGIYNGYEGMMEGKFDNNLRKNIANIMQRGGTVLKTARSKEFMEVEGRAKAYQQLKKNKIDALVAIGGNGTYTGALKLGQEHDLPIIGLPGTIDNDIYGTDYTIGFDTSINTAIDAIDKIRDTADSHSRLFFVEVMGRHAGYIALHTAIGSGAYSVFLPETDTAIPEWVVKLNKQRKKLFNIVIVAEGNKNGNANDIAQQVKESGFERDVRVTIIGHLQRGGSPTCHDRVLASRLGFQAVNCLKAGDRGIALGIVNGKLEKKSFEDAIYKTKKLDTDLLEMINLLSM